LDWIGLVWGLEGKRKKLTMHSSNSLSGTSTSFVAWVLGIMSYLFFECISLLAFLSFFFFFFCKAWFGTEKAIHAIVFPENQVIA
jgi:hypothetical protein